MRLSAAFRVALLCCMALVCLAAASESAAGRGNTAREQLLSQLESAVAAGDLDLAQAVQKQLLRFSRKEHSQRRKLLQPDTIDVSYASASVWAISSASYH
jgi:hypothetical protein